MLNLNQSPEELNELYGEKDYYWYLRSPQFHEAFLKPLANLISTLGTSCLDVGCGEGQLYDRVRPLMVRYMGFDGSANAIKRGREMRPHADLRVGRFEDPFQIGGPFEKFDVVVFGGILEVLVKPEKRVELLQAYQRRFDPDYFVVYDLQRLDIAPISAVYPMYSQVYRTVRDIDLPDAKLHRKIVAFKCQP